MHVMYNIKKAMEQVEKNFEKLWVVGMVQQKAMKQGRNVYGHNFT